LAISFGKRKEERKDWRKSDENMIRKLMKSLYGNYRL
jgi:hypothetical protein